MNRSLTMLALLAILAAGAPGMADPAPDRTSVFRVDGMTCSLCAKAIDKALRGADGVRSVAVDRAAERVTVVAAASISRDRLEQIIESAGSYDALPLAGGDSPGSVTP